MTNQQQLSLEHQIRPSSESNAPVIIMLHGYGSDENDLFSFSSELDERFFIVSARAPYPMFPFGHTWYTIHFEAPQGKWTDTEQALESRDKIAVFIDEVCEAYDVDSNRVILLGFSQGTILSIAAALTYPEKISDVVALSGYVNKDLIPTEINKDKISHLSFYCSHGTADQVIPVDWARKTPAFFDGIGIDYSYSEFPVGHGVAPQNFREFRDWLYKRY
ncbi:MAG: alpha/beta fold hydrolase [Flavobacteriaceae bacterium]|nr:alpha/beta fold hydrolase [Flavobacteriaceae bacterium]